MEALDIVALFQHCEDFLNASFELTSDLIEFLRDFFKLCVIIVHLLFLNEQHKERSEDQNLLKNSINYIDKIFALRGEKSMN